METYNRCIKQKKTTIINNNIVYGIYVSEIPSPIRLMMGTLSVPKTWFSFCGWVGRGTKYLDKILKCCISLKSLTINQ